MGIDFELSLLGKIVWEDRYALKDENGNTIEKDISETFQRVAKAIASKEEDSKKWEKKFYDVMAKCLYCPAGRILAHSGTHYSQLLNCFVLPFEEDSLEAIMNTVKNMAIIFKYGGGCGFNYSTLRPSGTHIKGVNGRSCGVIGFIHMMSTISEVIEQGGCLTDDTLINTNKGLFYFKELINENEQGWYPQNLILKTKDGDNNSSKYYVNGYSDIISITTDLGINIKGTLSHKLGVFTKEGFQWKEFKDLNKGDYVVSKMNQHEGQLQILGTSVNVNKDHHNCIVPKRLPDKIDKEFAFFLGYYLGNGFSGSRENDYRNGVSIPDKSYLNNKIKEIFEDLFGNNITLTYMKKPNDQSGTYYITNKIIKNYLKNNGLLKLESTEASLPQKIRCCSKEILGSFLSGLFEADGYVCHGYPQLNTSSYQLGKEVQILLLGLGIPCKFFKATKVKDHFSDKDMFCVKVISFKGLEVWNSLINPDEKSRLFECKTFKYDFNKEKNYVLPFAEYWLKGALEHLYSIEKSTEVKRLIKRLRSYFKGITAKNSLTLSAYYNLKKNKLIKELPSIDDCLFSKIISKNYDEDLTYDMEVNESHSYIANSLISHNSRRAASLGLLEIGHPDIWEFISFKNDNNWERLREFIDIRDEEKWTYFKFQNLYKLQMYNISIGITDEFLDALKNDQAWPLKWNGEEWELYTVSFKKYKIQKNPEDNDYTEKRFEVTANNEKTALWKLKRIIPFPTSQDKLEVISRRKIKASEIWDRICKYAWADGCPGLMNISAIRKMHNIEYISPVSASNPCGEQYLSAYGSCNLSSLVLSSFIDGEKKEINYNLLRNTIHTAVRFADNVIDICQFPILEIEKKAQEERRIGLGVMGVHDMLIKLGLGYGTEEGRKVIEDVLIFIRDEAYKASIELAKERGSFPLFNKDKFMESGFIKTLPEVIQEKIKESGIHNSTLLSIAPTGTTGTMLNVSTGCEPWYSLSYQRNTRLGSYEDGCPAYFEWRKNNLDKEIPTYFKTAQEISPEDHIKMLILFSKYVDSSVSKTVNLSSSATVDDVKKIFLMAMNNGVKGVTIFRDQSKEGVMVNKKVVEKAKEVIDILQNVKEEEKFDSRMFPKKRGNRAEGATYRVHMHNHNLYITTNRNKENNLVEIFATVGESKKPNAHHTSGVEDSWAEGLGKMISLALRAGVETDAIIRNLKNIPSDKPIFTNIGENQSSELIPSPPHAIARVIEEELKYFNKKEKEMIMRSCEICGSINTKSKSPTCYECLDCFFVSCF